MKNNVSVKLEVEVISIDRGEEYEHRHLGYEVRVGGPEGARVGVGRGETVGAAFASAYDSYVVHALATVAFERRMEKERKERVRP